MDKYLNESQEDAVLLLVFSIFPLKIKKVGRTSALNVLTMPCQEKHDARREQDRSMRCQSALRLCTERSRHLTPQLHRSTIRDCMHAASQNHHQQQHHRHCVMARTHRSSPGDALWGPSCNSLRPLRVSSIRLCIARRPDVRWPTARKVKSSTAFSQSVGSEAR